MFRAATSSLKLRHPEEINHYTTIDKPVGIHPNFTGLQVYSSLKPFLKKKKIQN